MKFLEALERGIPLIGWTAGAWIRGCDDDPRSQVIACAVGTALIARHGIEEVFKIRNTTGLQQLVNETWPQIWNPVPFNNEWTIKAGDLRIKESNWRIIDLILAVSDDHPNHREAVILMLKSFPACPRFSNIY